MEIQPGLNLFVSITTIESLYFLDLDLLCEHRSNLIPRLSMDARYSQAGSIINFSVITLATIVIVCPHKA